MIFYAIISHLAAIIFQLIIGGLAMSKKIKLSFGWLTLINLVFICCITLAWVQFIIPKVEGPQCGISQMTTMFLGVGSLGVQLFIVILQLIWIYAMGKESKNM